VIPVSDDTKYGHLADNDDEDRRERDEDEEEEPGVEVKRHTVVIDDESEEAVDDRGVRYHFYVERGVVVSYTAGHFFDLSGGGKNKMQTDPMRVGWNEIGDTVKSKLEDELNVDDIVRHLDLPEHLRRVERGGLEKSEEAERRDELDERLEETFD